MKLATFSVHIAGNWCDGYYWQLVRLDSNRVLHESGPYHSCDLNCPRAVAFDDAVHYAQVNEIPISSDLNPYRQRGE